MNVNVIDDALQYTTDITYRLFPTESGFGEIKVGFENTGTKNVEILNITISTNEDQSVNLLDEVDLAQRKTTITNGGIDSVLYTFPLTKELLKTIDINKQKFLGIKLTLLEYGYDHWGPIHFKTLQQTSGFSYTVTYPDNCACVAYNTYGQAIEYNIIDNKINKISFNTSQWLNDGAGVSLVVSKKKNQKKKK